MRAPSLQGKVAIVTGGTRGIGREITRVLVADGANAVVCGRDEGRVQRVAAELSRTGPGTCVGKVCDVRRYDQVEALVRHAAETFGGLDILVNNAPHSHAGSWGGG